MALETSDPGKAENAVAAGAPPPLTADQTAQVSLDRLFGPDEDDKVQAAARLAADLDATGGDLTFGEDIIEDVSLEGLQEELDRFQEQEAVANILGQGSDLREFARDVEDNLRQVELESIQDYIRESDNLVSLHTQIQDCDKILGAMEAMLSGFQSDLGFISTEIKTLQEQSMTMGVKLKNRKAAETKLAKFVEEVVVPPELIVGIMEQEVSEQYLKHLHTLHKKLLFLATDPTAQASASYRDVEPELQKLRAKAVLKCRDFLLSRFQSLRKPKTNIQILQQNVLLKHKPVAEFLRDHGKEVWPEVRANYIEIMTKIASAYFKTYITQLEKLQLDISTKNDLIGVDDSKSAGIFSRNRDALKNRSAVFVLGDRANVLKESEQPAIIPHIAESSGHKFPYEVLFRSIHRLLLDTATSEYLFCQDFFGPHDETVWGEIFSSPFAVIDEHFNEVLPTCHDAIGLMLMIRLTYQHQLVMSKRRVPCLDAYLDKMNMLIWPRFKAVFDLHLNSVRGANVRALWEDDVHAHYVTRRYAEFTSALLLLNTEQGDQQLELNLERLRTCVDDLLVKLSRMFPKQKQQTIFLINNYDVILQVFKEAGCEGCKAAQQFEELLNSSITIFVELELLEHFGRLIAFVKIRTGPMDDATSPSGGATGKATAPPPVGVGEVEPLVKDFAMRWKAAIEVMHKDVITYFSNFIQGMEILKAALTQLLLYYTRLLDTLKRSGGGAALGKDVVSIPSIMYEIKKYSRTF